MVSFILTPIGLRGRACRYRTSAVGVYNVAEFGKAEGGSGGKLAGTRLALNAEQKWKTYMGITEGIRA